MRWLFLDNYYQLLCGLQAVRQTTESLLDYRGLLWYVVNSLQSAGELVAPASAVSTVSDFLTQSATSPESRDSCWIMFSIKHPLMVTYLCKSTQKYILLHCPAGPEFDLHRWASYCSPEKGVDIFVKFSFKEHLNVKRRIGYLNVY